MIILPEVQGGGALVVAEEGPHAHRGLARALRANEHPGHGEPGRRRSRESSRSVENLLGEADEALYASKENGRNRVTLRQPARQPSRETSSRRSVRRSRRRSRAVRGAAFRVRQSRLMRAVPSTDSCSSSTSTSWSSVSQCSVMRCLACSRQRPRMRRASFSIAWTVASLTPLSAASV